MKSKEELSKLKEEYEKINKKLSELSQEELKEVAGGTLDGAYGFEVCSKCGSAYKILSKTWKGVHMGGSEFDYHVKCKNPECGYEWSFTSPF